MGITMRFAPAPMRRELPETARNEIREIINSISIPARVVAQ
jgi:hypothetical protein